METDAPRVRGPEYPAAISFLPDDHHAWWAIEVDAANVRERQVRADDAERVASGLRRHPERIHENEFQEAGARGLLVRLRRGRGRVDTGRLILLRRRRAGANDH